MDVRRSLNTFGRRLIVEGIHYKVDYRRSNKEVIRNEVDRKRVFECAARFIKGGLE